MFTVKVVHQARPKAIAIGVAEPNPHEPLPALEAMTTDEVVFESTQVRMGRDGRLTSVELGPESGVQEVRSAPSAAADPVGHIYCDTESGQIVYDVRGSVAQEDPDIIMFVMNRFGATVAKYYL